MYSQPILFAVIMHLSDWKHYIQCKLFYNQKYFLEMYFYLQTYLKDSKINQSINVLFEKKTVWLAFYGSQKA